MSLIFFSLLSVAVKMHAWQLLLPYIFHASFPPPSVNSFHSVSDTFPLYQIIYWSYNGHYFHPSLAEHFHVPFYNTCGMFPEQTSQQCESRAGKGGGGICVLRHFVYVQLFSYRQHVYIVCVIILKIIKNG